MSSGPPVPTAPVAVDVAFSTWRQPGPPPHSSFRPIITAQLIASIGVSAVAAAGGLLASELSGEWAASLPLGALVIGSGVGALAIARITQRHSRAHGLRLGYAVGLLGAVVGLLAAATRSLLVLVVGTTLVGLGNSAVMLSRYAIADLAPAHERARTIGRSLLAVACGSILGPLLLDPAGRAASAFGAPAASGSYASAAIVLLLASLVLAGRPESAVPHPLASTADRLAPAAATGAFHPVRRALFALAAANLTMVAMMAVYPSHLHRAGHGLGITGVVVSAHVCSMFAMSPLIGRCTDRYGTNEVVAVGAAIICISCLVTAVSPVDSAWSATVALIALGIGWNAQLVAASALLTHNAEPDRCARLESHGEIAMSAAAAIGALALAPWLFAQTGIRPLAGIMIPLNAIVAATTIAVLRTRRTARALTTETTT